VLMDACQCTMWHDSMQDAKPHDARLCAQQSHRGSFCFLPCSDRRRLGPFGQRDRCPHRGTM
jgi:hypothetical protein